jgi:excinuclease ABC subunit B
MYADRITGSMQRAIDETNRRRAVQLAYNEEHGITPRTVRKSHDEIMGQTSLSDMRRIEPAAYAGPDTDTLTLAAEPVIALMKRDELEKVIKKTEKQMEGAAKDLDFLQAAKYRDELAQLRQMLKTKRD